ncbi:MAG: NAD(P)H-dependent oxidoreductase [Methylacidiphilales bacterium]|nr:NAD(P)H-dependent oxidoreductase [Candidatus Methylacidiphilales bacterium]
MTDSRTTDNATLLAALHWRYATKAFDPAKTIPADTWKTLEEALILSPSSFGLQPWRFIIVTSPEIKAKLRPHSWNQAQVTDCSHYVVFATIKKISEADIDASLARTVEVRGVKLETLQGYRSVMVGDLIHGARSKVAAEWAARQAYIALGNFMTAAALLGVDTCPMEGFVPDQYDKILGLEARGLTASVCCAAGYRGESCKYAHLAKVRFPRDKMIETI